MTPDPAGVGGGGPLAGIRVLEMANFISGPYASMLLGDLGAEVIKVELPGSGDPFRKWGGHKGGARPQFLAYNRGKRSITLNVQAPGGQEAYRRLAAQVDVLIENFRPGTLDRLGVGYEALKPDNPRLVYCAISGMGRTGPYARRPSYESIGLALSGLWSRFTNLRDPRPIGPNVADQLTSLYAVYGVLGALVHVARHGVGQVVEINMLHANMAFMPEPIANYFVLGEVGDPHTRATRSQAYAVVGSDGLPLTVHLSSITKFWEGLTRALGEPELAADPRFATNTARVANYEALNEHLQRSFSARPRAEWLARLQAEDVPSAPINSIDEAVADPQTQHLRVIREYGSADRAVQLVACPATFEQTPTGDRLAPPELGEHTVEILTALGFTPARIEELRAEGAI
jgi:crotonobetainyl-CoA:carnitine CoA-transferase CaiB-like acyl-CoA transferase